MATYVQYRVRLRRARWPLREGDKLWRKPVYSYRDTYYDAEDLRDRHRWSWRLRFFMWRDDRGLEIEGLGSDGKWRAVSPWLIDERRGLAGAVRLLWEGLQSGTESAEKIAERMADDYRGPNLVRARGEAAWHLTDHLRVGWRKAAKVMRAMGFEDVVADDVRKLADNGRVRIDQGKECSFCPSRDSVPV